MIFRFFFFFSSRRRHTRFDCDWSSDVCSSDVVCAMPTRLVAYAPEDGKLLWWCDGIRFNNGDLSYSSPVVAGDIVVSIGGYGGPGIGVKLGGSGDVTATNRVWRKASNPQSIG